VTALVTPARPEGIKRIEDVEAFLARCGYVGDREIAKTLADALATTLFRLQCYEGLDA